MINLLGFSGENSSFMLIGLVAVMFVLMYFTSIRPQKKKQKEHQAMMADLKKGDKIMTVGGFQGIIFSVNEDKDEIVIELVPDKTKVTIVKSAIMKKIVVE